MTPAERPWVLDTSIIVHVLRSTPLGRHLIEQQQIRARAQVPMISVVTVGELLSLGRQLNWGEAKLALMREVVSGLVIVDINSEPLLNSYAEIDAWCRQNGFKSGKNDLWIAATAAVTDSELLTADRDFDPLHQKFVQRVYYDPRSQYP